MNGKAMSHNRYKKLKQKTKLKEAEKAAIENVLDKACKSSAATKGRKQVKDWRTEMQGDEVAGSGRAAWAERACRGCPK